MLSIFSAQSYAFSIKAGTDYFKTTGSPLLSYDFGQGDGVQTIELKAPDIPSGPYGSNVIIERENDAELPTVGSTDSIDIEIVALTLVSVDPVSIGGTLYDVMFELGDSDESPGTMVLYLEDSVGGHFNATDICVATIDITDTVGGTTTSTTENVQVTTTSPAGWSYPWRIAPTSWSCACANDVYEPIIHFETLHIPEPFSIILLTLSLLGLHWIKRDKR